MKREAVQIAKQTFKKYFGSPKRSPPPLPKDQEDEEVSDDEGQASEMDDEEYELSPNEQVTLDAIISSEQFHFPDWQYPVRAVRQPLLTKCASSGLIKFVIMPL